MILGIDEVGRGPWAGPLVVGAVVLPSDHTLQGLTDSKKLTKRQRERLAPAIMTQAVDWSLGWVTASELDEIGMTEALKLATRRAVEPITCSYHEIIIDGTINLLADTTKGQYATTLKKADLLIPAVSAASILAKVARDDYMTDQALMYPTYGFERHAGYGTAAHRAAIEQHGVTPLHRLSFAPLARYRATSQSTSRLTKCPATASRLTSLDSSSGAVGAADVSGHLSTIDGAEARTTKETGDTAETKVAQYLEAGGHTIIERNWRTKFCEIDIISQKGNTLYFTEVKYRKNDQQGGGLAAITPTKLRQMRFAAEYYLLKHQSDALNASLAVADVAGADFVLGEWLELQE